MTDPDNLIEAVAIPNEYEPYSDCFACRGGQFINAETGEKMFCGNCRERRRAEVYTREDCAFWWVWTKNGLPPRKFHQSQAAAEAEAIRLTLKHGRKFIVLHAYTKFSATKAPLLASMKDPDNG